MSSREYDSKQLAGRLKKRLRHKRLSQLSREEIHDVGPGEQIGLEVLKVSPKDRCEKQMETLQIMMGTNKFFAELRRQYGELTFTQMVRHCYLE